MDNQKELIVKKGPPPKNRLIWGTVVFISGFFSPVFIPLVVSSGLSNGVKTVLSGLLAFGVPELFMVIAAGIMGKEGFNYIKRFINLLFKAYGPPDSVSKIRYKIGLFLFIFPLICGFFLPYLISIFPSVLDYFLWIAITTDITLVISLFILGGNFWDKLRGLFIQDAIIQLPKN